MNKVRRPIALRGSWYTKIWQNSEIIARLARQHLLLSDSQDVNFQAG